MHKTKTKKLFTLFFISFLIVLNTLSYVFFSKIDNRKQFFSTNDSNKSFSDPRIVVPSIIHDADGDKIADTLSKLISGDLSNISDSSNALREGGKKVEVMICVNRKPDSTLIKKFKEFGAEIISVYDNLIYAIAAVLPIEKISAVAANSFVTLIENQAYSTAHLDTSTVNMGIRGSPYVWDATPEIKGNPNYSIAILDTGVDSSHSDMQNFLYFQDFSSHGYPSGSTGIDYGHHGTHCASIAAGTGNADIDPNTVEQTISDQFYSSPYYYWITHWFEVKDNLNQPNTSITLDWDTSGGGSAEFMIRDSTATIVSPSGPYSTTPIIHNLNLTSGWYQVVVWPEVAATCNKDYTITIEHESKYMLSAEPVSSPVYTGIAPQSKIVCLKVLDDSGSGTGTWFLNAINWISINGKNSAYNITTVSMSIGFDGIYSSIDTAVNNLVDQGFVCVSSAGNDGTNYGNNAIKSPGTAQKCITVGAVNDAFEITYYSSNGDSVYNKPDVVAPGGTYAISGSSSLHNLILAADSNYGEDSNSMSDIVSSDYRGMQGTSMSCPHVAGLAQLVIDAIIETEGNWTWSSQNALRVKQLICMGTWEVNAGETIDWDGDGIPQNPPLNRIGRDVVEGFGMVRGDAVIQSITNSTTGPFTNISYNLDRRAGTYALDHKVVLFSLDAVVGTNYIFTLSVPSTGDFDLILYDNDYDLNSGIPIISSSSINSGLGVDESLIFTPSENGTYYWSIRAVQGNGTCQISMLQSVNIPPNAPSNPSPSNGVTGVSKNPTLSVDVSDPDGNAMNVSFYDAFDDSLIGTDYGVSSGGTASINWLGLSGNTEYEWYAIADDGTNFTQSATWSFTTVNTAPDAPTNPVPADDATGVSVNPTLSVDVSDPDGDTMDVSFYDASDDSLIGTDTGVSSGGTASITWSGLSEGTIYSWYAIASDGSASTNSSTWSFTTYIDEPTWDQTPTDQIIEYGASLNYDVNASDLSGIDNYWINDTTHFNIDSNGLLTNKTILIPGTYWLEVRAYDPYDNYCTEIIRIIVKAPEQPPETPSPKISGFNVIFLICTISIVSLVLITLKKKY